MGNMALGSETGVGTMAKGTGTVTAIDKASGKITLNHGLIAEADGPQWTMAFVLARGIPSNHQRKSPY